MLLLRQRFLLERRRQRLLGLRVRENVGLGLELVHELRVRPGLLRGRRWVYIVCKRPISTDGGLYGIVVHKLFVWSLQLVDWAERLRVLPGGNVRGQHRRFIVPFLHRRKIL